MSFVHKVSLTFFTSVLLILIGIAAGIVIARAIGSEGKGILSLAVMAAALVFNATNMGIGTGSGYFLGRRKVPLDTIAGTWLSLSLMLGVSFTIVALLLAPHLVPRLLPSVPVLFVSLTLGSVPFLILLYNYQSLFKASDDFRRFNILELVQPAAALVIFIVLAYLFPAHRTLAVVLHPRVAHGSEEEANRDTAKISRQTILLVSLGCIVILLIGRFLVELLYSERFLPAVVTLFLLLPGILSAGLARVVSSDLERGISPNQNVGRARGARLECGVEYRADTTFGCRRGGAGDDRFLLDARPRTDLRIHQNHTGHTRRVARSPHG